VNCVILFPAFVPNLQFAFCVHASPETAAGVLLAEIEEGAAGGSAAGGGSLDAAAADVFAAAAALVALLADPDPAGLQPANNTVPATLPNNEITCRRCIEPMLFSANAARSGCLYFIAKTLRQASPFFSMPIAFAYQQRCPDIPSPDVERSRSKKIGISRARNLSHHEARPQMRQVSSR
jgi:hypothetical protein